MELQRQIDGKMHAVLCPRSLGARLIHAKCWYANEIWLLFGLDPRFGVPGKFWPQPTTTSRDIRIREALGWRIGQPQGWPPACCMHLTNVLTYNVFLIQSSIENNLLIHSTDFQFVCTIVYFLQLKVQVKMTSLSKKKTS